MNLLLTLLRWVFRRPQPKKSKIRIELFADEETETWLNRSA